VKLWINAFIPAEVSDITMSAPDTGTMVKGPPLVPGGGDCYRTDNRDFSSDIHAPSRMHSEVEIAISGPSINFQFHQCFPTHRIDCGSGATIMDATASTSRMEWSNLRGNVTVDPQGGLCTDPNPNLVQIDLDDAGNNPCLTSPDIDMLGTAMIDPVGRTVRFVGTVEPFPAFEMYAAADNGEPTTVFQLGPQAGADPFNLVGEPNRSIDVTVSF
jgi:hypothetical protein